MTHAATAAWRLDRVAANASFHGERNAFEAYVSVPLHRAKYDFVSVDGRARGRCLDRVRADRLVKQGGIVMLDNSKRKKYAAARRAFDRMGWARVQQLVESAVLVALQIGSPASSDQSAGC